MLRPHSTLHIHPLLALENSRGHRHCMTWKQGLNRWETIKITLSSLSLSSELRQEPLVRTQTAPVALRFLSSYNDRVAWGFIFFFLVTKQLQLILWDLNAMNVIDCLLICLETEWQDWKRCYDSGKIGITAEKWPLCCKCCLCWHR